MANPTEMSHPSPTRGSVIEGSGELMASWNPTTGMLVESFSATLEDEVAGAVRRASEAAARWAETPPVERCALLLGFAAGLDHKEGELISLVVEEVGKPVREAREEVSRAIQIVRYHAAAALDPSGETIPSPATQGLVYTSRRPLGAVGLITPWNFPVAIPLWKLAPALAYGNTVVWKPAPHATAAALRLASTLEESGVPDGVVNVVLGGGATGEALARAPLAGLSFTGSTASGRAVAREALTSGARFQGELGGKNASVVLADADLDRAVETIVTAAFGFAGQKCTATSRVIVQRAVAGAFCERLLARVATLRVGDPADDATEVGPLIEPAAVSRTLGFVERAQSEGAELLAGGRPSPELGPSYFAPTIVGAVDPRSELSQVEVFGPVLAVLEASDPDEALALANGTPYGLAAAVFTRDLQLALRFAERLEAGVVKINGPTPGVLFNAPFGPIKASGIGLAEQGKAARDFFTQERTVTVVG